MERLRSGWSFRFIKLSSTTLNFLGCFLCEDFGHYSIDFPQLRWREASLVSLRYHMFQYQLPHEGLKAKTSGTVVTIMVLGAPLLFFSGI